MRPAARTGTPGESVYTAELAEAVCARVAAGESLMRLAQAAGMPHRTTLRNWARTRPEFAEALAAAMRTARTAGRPGGGGAQAGAAEPVKGGKPSTYTPAMGKAICAGLANGESLVAIGRDPAMPCAGTVYGWVRRHPEFEDLYVQARRMQADYLFDEAREVALAATPKTVWVERLRFDVIRWQTARLAPRKYCERLLVASVEAEPEPPLTIEVRNSGAGRTARWWRRSRSIPSRSTGSPAGRPPTAWFRGPERGGGAGPGRPPAK